MDEEQPMDVESVGQRLRGAREARGMSLEDVAAATRIPTRHLTSLEDSDWDKLPAATYSVGFAKNYASAVGLDRNQIADQLRAEMGSSLPAHYSTATDSFETVDSNRTMPKPVVFGAVAAVILIALLLTFLNNRQYGADDAATTMATDNGVVAAPTPATPSAQGPVVITASEAAWIEVKDGATILRQGELAAGQSFEVPANAARPTLTTAKPEALRISVGTGDAPSIGPAGTRVADVSLRAEELMRGPAPGAAVPTPPTPLPERATAPAPRRSVPRQVDPSTSPPPVVVNSTDAPPTTNSN